MIQQWPIRSRTNKSSFFLGFPEFRCRFAFGRAKTLAYTVFGVNIRNNNTRLIIHKLKTMIIINRTRYIIAAPRILPEKFRGAYNWFKLWTPSPFHHGKKKIIIIKNGKLRPFAEIALRRQSTAYYYYIIEPSLRYENVSDAKPYSSRGGKTVKKYKKKINNKPTTRRGMYNRIV